MHLSDKGIEMIILSLVPEEGIEGVFISKVIKPTGGLTIPQEAGGPI